MARTPASKKHKSITRRVSPEDLRDLLVSPPRASLAFVEDARVQALPVSFRYDEARYWFGIVDPSGYLVPGAPVHLLIDDGEYHTELRGMAISGRVGDRPTRPIASGAPSWFEVVPDRISAWDYDAMRRRTQ